MKSGTGITIDNYDIRNIANQNTDMSERIQIYEAQVSHYGKQLSYAQKAYNDVVRESIRLRSLLESSGIPYDGKADPRLIRNTFIKETTENQKLKEILQREGIDYDAKTMTYKGNRSKYFLQIALKETARLKKLTKLPVLDIWDAVERGSLGYAKFFIEEDPSIIFATKNGSTALHRAFELGDINMIRYLVDSGADKDQETSNGTTTIMLAARSGSMEAFSLATEGVTDEEILKKRPDGLTTLHCAVSGNNLAIIKILLEKGSQINAKTVTGVTPMMCIEEYNPAVFDFLLSNGANVKESTVTNRTMIHVACRSGSYEFIQRVISLGVPLDTVTNDGCNALHMAIVGGNKLVIQTLMNDFPINSKTKLGYTPLLIAIQAEDIELTKFIITCGANISEVLNDGKTALHIAAITGNVELCKFLLDKGIPIDCIDNDNNTPVMLACAQRYVDVVDFLCSRGATIQEDFDEAVKKSPTPSRLKILVDPMIEIPELMKENEELKKNHFEMKEIIDDYQAVHPDVLLAEENTQTEVTGAVHKRLLNQIGIVTIDPDKDIAANIKIYQEENRKLLNEISELTEFKSNFNTVKTELAEAEEELEKQNEKKRSIKKRYKVNKKKHEEEKRKMKIIIRIVAGIAILLFAALIYLMFGNKIN